MKAKLEAINSKSREEAVEYLQKVHQSTLVGRERIFLIEACESRIEHLNRDVAMVTKAEFD